MILSKCDISSSKKSRFVKNPEAEGLLSNLVLKTLLSKVPLLGDILFYLYKMNKIVDKFLLAGDKFMPGMHLKKPGFTYSACGPLTNNKERTQKFKERGDTKFSYWNELDKACFQHNLAYGDFKDIARITASDKDLRDKLALDIAKNPNTMDKKENLHLGFTDFLVKCSKVAVLGIAVGYACK